MVKLFFYDKFIETIPPSQSLCLHGKIFLRKRFAFFLSYCFFLQVCFSGIKFGGRRTKFLICGIEGWGEKFCFLQEQIFLPAEVSDFLRMIMVTHKSVIYKLLGRNFLLLFIQSPLQNYLHFVSLAYTDIESIIGIILSIKCTFCEDTLFTLFFQPLIVKS